MSPPNQSPSFPWPRSLGLRAGELVEVRSREEIFATLDEKLCLDGMPFMPEMLRYCGRRVRVSRRAEKACDTLYSGEGRRIRDAVHLADLRCDGAGHGGCQALCLMWWKEAWLKPPTATHVAPSPATGWNESDLVAAAGTTDPETRETVYSCQVTRLLDFTEEQSHRAAAQYLREVRGGNVGAFTAAAVLLRAGLNVLRGKLGLRPRPDVRGSCVGKTPAAAPIGIKPGDWVVVKSQAEIEQTLDGRKRNRGLAFDVEMLPYCGRRMRVLQKVDHIIDEKTGRMRELPNDCWILEGAWCGGYLSRGRLFCTRAIYPYWREIWLRRADEAPASADRLS